jgi:hypothetical protein
LAKIRSEASKILILSFDGASKAHHKRVMCCNYHVRSHDGTESKFLTFSRVAFYIASTPCEFANITLHGNLALGEASLLLIST